MENKSSQQKTRKNSEVSPPRSNKSVQKCNRKKNMCKKWLIFLLLSVWKPSKPWRRNFCVNRRYFFTVEATTIFFATLYQHSFCQRASISIVSSTRNACNLWLNVCMLRKSLAVVGGHFYCIVQPRAGLEFINQFAEKLFPSSGELLIFQV